MKHTSVCVFFVLSHCETRTQEVVVKIVLKGKHAQTGMTRFGVMVINLRQVIIAPEGDPMTNQILDAVDHIVDIERPDGRYNVVAVAETNAGKLLEIKSGKVNVVKDLDDVAVDSILTMADVPAEPAAAVPADAFGGVNPMEPMAMDFGLGSEGSPPPPPAATPKEGEAPVWPADDENWNASATEEASATDKKPAAVIPPDASKTLTEGDAPDVKALKGRITELENDNARLNTENKKLRDESLNEGNTELSETKIALLKTLNEATDGLAKKEDENSSLGAMLDKANREIKKLRFDLRTANGKIEDETKRANAAEEELKKPKPTVEGASMKPDTASTIPPAKSDVQVHRHEHALTPEVTALLSTLTNRLSGKKSGFGSIVMVLLAIALGLFGLLKVAEWIPSFKPALRDVNVALGFPSSTETTTVPSTVDEKRLADAERQLTDNGKKLADANRELKALSESQRVVTADRDKLQKLLATIPNLKAVNGQVTLPAQVAPQGAAKWMGSIGGKNLETVAINTPLKVGEVRGFMALFFYGENNGYLGYAIVLVAD